jgi:hypothetical protein
MTLDQFRRTLAQATPPPDISDPVVALWWAAKGDWERAHTIVMNDDSGEAAWVHAHLHRQEGDSDNAQYWYSRARQPAASEPLEAEWENIVGALL